jgi:phosphatidylserine synthase
MKLKDKYHWNSFIYDLIYPGFVGSMIYELIPTTKTDDSFETYFTLPTIIKILITIFYCVDYLHCYGDMNAKVKKEDRSWIYLLSDVASSVFFFLAFVMVKLEHYQKAILFIAFVPLFFIPFKRKNCSDRYFHIPYLVISLLIALVSILSLNKIFEIRFITDSKFILFWYTLVSLIIYCFYVFYYYEKYSRPEYKKLYGDKQKMDDEVNTV